MVQAGHTLKYNRFMDWKQRLIINWSENERKTLEQWLESSDETPAKKKSS